MLVVFAAVWVFVWALARVLPEANWEPWRKFELVWLRAARHKRATGLAMLLLPGVAAALFYARSGFPIPSGHDEFSYLLAGDTFASGRLTNPPHLEWRHFETIHILQQPTYMSMYPPAQGIFLALGQKFGHPWIGVVVSSMLACWAMWWASGQWLSPRWALLAGTLGLLCFLGTSWTLSYWGGSVAALGGALATGATAMIIRRGRIYAGALFAVGALLCLNSRPYEGAVLCTALGLSILIRTRLRSLRYAPAFLAVLLPGVIWMVAYNRAVTGHPFRLPYDEAARQYIVRRRFWWQEDRPAPQFRHAEMQRVYESLKRRHIPLRDQYADMWDRFSRIYLSPSLFPLFLLSAMLGWKRRALRVPLATAWAGIGAVVAIPYIHPHYYAPFAACMMAVAAGMMQWAGRVKLRGRRVGWAVCALLLLLLGKRLWTGCTQSPATPEWAKQRQELLESLTSRHKAQLIVVRYGPKHDAHEEWVYNKANLEQARVVWARSMGSAADQQLLSSFPSRESWLLYVEGTHTRLEPLPAAEP